MDNWVRNAVMLVALIVWSTVVIVNLIRGIPPDAITWGVPGGIWFVLNPTIPKSLRDRGKTDPPKEPDTGEITR